MAAVYFQDHMPGNICFGCGAENEAGLQIKSYWEEDGATAVCHWEPVPKYWGWRNLLNGGIMATLIDCHCMGTAMADAYRREERSLDSQPEYRYATGTLNIKYLAPTPGNGTVTLRAQVLEQKGRKTVLRCELWAAEQLRAEAEVVALRVYDSSSVDPDSPFAD